MKQLGEGPAGQSPRRGWGLGWCGMYARAPAQVRGSPARQVAGGAPITLPTVPGTLDSGHCLPQLHRVRAVLLSPCPGEAGTRDTAHAQSHCAIWRKSQEKQGRDNHSQPQVPLLRTRCQSPQEAKTLSWGQMGPARQASQALPPSGLQPGQPAFPVSGSGALRALALRSLARTWHCTRAY